MTMIGVMMTTLVTFKGDKRYSKSYGMHGCSYMSIGVQSAFNMAFWCQKFFINRVDESISRMFKL